MRRGENLTMMVRPLLTMSAFVMLFFSLFLFWGGGGGGIPTIFSGVETTLRPVFSPPLDTKFTLPPKKSIRKNGLV